MQFSEIRDVVKNQLTENNIYRTNTLIDTMINRGYSLVAGMSLYDVRRIVTDVDGARNVVSLAGTQNMLSNGDFELGALTNWDAQGTAGAGDSVSIDSSYAVGGTYSMKVVCGGNDAYGRQQQEISVTPGLTYVLEGYIYVSAYTSGYVNLDVQAYNNAGDNVLDTNDLRLTATNGGWKRYTDEATIPANTTEVKVRCFGDNTPEFTAYFDNIRLYPKHQNIVAPLYVSIEEAGASANTRLHPVLHEELEFYSSDWFGAKDDQSMYYALSNPYHNAYEFITIVPAPLTHDSTPAHEMNITTLCAVEPAALSSDTDEPSLPRQFHDMLVKYALFECYLGEPGRVADALAQYKEFTNRMDQLIAHLKARFPSGRDFEPFSPEFISDTITRRRQESE